MQTAPIVALRKTKMCKFFAAGTCAKGEACGFAHGYTDLQNRPDLWKTQLCMAFERNGRCFDSANCKYAHGLEELRSIEPCQTTITKISGPTNDLDKSITSRNVPSPCVSKFGLYMPYNDRTDHADVQIPLRMPVPMTSKAPCMALDMMELQKQPPLQASTTGIMQKQPPLQAVLSCRSIFHSNQSTASDDDDDVRFRCSPSPDSLAGFETPRAACSLRDPDLTWPSPDSFATKSTACSSDVITMLEDEILGQDSECQNRATKANETPLFIPRKTRICKFFAKGVCKKGESCSFAHWESVAPVQPDFHRTGDTSHYAHVSEMQHSRSEGLRYRDVEALEDAIEAQDQTEAEGPIYLSYVFGRVFLHSTDAN